MATLVPLLARKSSHEKAVLGLLFSFLLPGAGLVYLGKWKWGLLNLALVLAVGALAVCLLPEDVFDRYIRYLGYGCAGGSGGLAQQWAIKMNKEMTGERRATPPS